MDRPWTVDTIKQFREALRSCSGYLVLPVQPIPQVSNLIRNRLFQYVAIHLPNLIADGCPDATTNLSIVGRKVSPQLSHLEHRGPGLRVPGCIGKIDAIQSRLPVVLD